MKNAVVFGSSAPVKGDLEYEEAYDVGKILAENGFAVMNGGYFGTMEAVSKGAKSANGKTIGFTVDILDYEEPNKFLDEEVRSRNLHERVKKQIDKGDIFIVLKGSTGTMHELLEVWEGMQLKILPKKPIICLGDHFKEIVEKLSSIGKHKSVKTEENLIQFAEDIDDLRRILKK